VSLFRRWRDALAVLAVVGLLALAAPGARAVAAGLRARVEGPSILLLEIPVAAAAVAATLAVALFVRLRRRRADAEDDDGVPPPPRRNPWARFVALAIILVLVALPATRQFIARQLRLQRPELPAPAVSAAPSPAPAGPVRIPSRAGELVAVAALGLLGVLLLALLARRSTRRRSGVAIRRPRRTAGTALAQAAAAGATELSGDDPRTAVLRCYAAMARVLARAGVSGRASDVPRELLARAAANGTVPAGPVRELTDLFGAARYSSHPVTEADRQAAATALQRIRDGAP